MKQNRSLFMTQAAMIAAVYVVLTFVGASFALGPVQVRFAEALAVLPFFTPAAVPGLFAGCLVGNLLAGAILPDIIFGSLATLIGAWGSRHLRSYPMLVSLPPILSNTIIIPFILRYAYCEPIPIPFMMLTVGIGEVISCGILGYGLIRILGKYRNIIFKEL